MQYYGEKTKQALLQMCYSVNTEYLIVFMLFPIPVSNFLAIRRAGQVKLSLQVARNLMLLQFSCFTIYQRVPPAALLNVTCLNMLYK